MIFRSLAGRMFHRLSIFLRGAYWSRRLGSFGAGARVYPTVQIYKPKNVHLGRNAVINGFVHIWGAGGVEIGDNSLIAAHTVITSQTHTADALRTGRLYRETLELKPVKIGTNVWIGSNVTILPGIDIGDNVIVAAGAVVTKSVPSDTLVAGVPARHIKSLLI